MEEVIRRAKCWLVHHPNISNFEWKRGTTNGASVEFLIVTVICYILLTFIFHRYSFLPQLQPSRLRLVSAVYNLFSFSLSLVMAVGCSLSTFSQMPNPHWIFCFPANRTPTRGPVFFWGYVFYVSKIVEFTDTLLILLSGSSTRRLSFLHVFHHSMVLIMSYIWVDAPLSLFPLGVVTNAMVHTVMYSYYLLCSVGVRPSWKKMVTNIQIIQFVFGYFAAAVGLYYHLVKYPCSGHKYAWSFNVVFNSSLLFLFVDFHTKNYKHKKLIAKEQEDCKKVL